MNNQEKNTPKATQNSTAFVSLFIIILATTVLITLGKDTGLATAPPQPATTPAQQPTFLLYTGAITLLILTLLVIIYLTLPHKHDIELIPQPGQELLTTLHDNNENKEETKPTPLQAYIARELARGAPLDAIASHLLAAGWPPQTIRYEINQAAKHYTNMSNIPPPRHLSKLTRKLSAKKGKTPI
ncbi:hypothetical protein D6783_04645 [Candidatus Woesearchaeota archaeon]|nr:MAG: hypothetical protein D6783_04645 [Candidatus Woesearchaeota archaeon]